jgi:predicted membrane protein
MKIKNLILGSLGICATCLSIYIICIVKKGKRFEKTLNISYDSLDTSVVFDSKKLSFDGLEMKDLQIGGFFGGLDLDMSKVITHKNNYTLKVTIHYAGINIVVPNNFLLTINDHCKFGDISDETVCSDLANPVTLNVIGDITLGGLHFENPPKQIFNI